MALIIKNIEEFDPAMGILFESIVARLGLGRHREPSLTPRESRYLESLLAENLEECPDRVLRIQLSIGAGA